MLVHVVHDEAFNGRRFDTREPSVPTTMIRKSLPSLTVAGVLRVTPFGLSHEDDQLPLTKLL